MAHFPDITPCSDYKNLSVFEEKYVWEYRNLGVKCEK